MKTSLAKAICTTLLLAPAPIAGGEETMIQMKKSHLVALCILLVVGTLIADFGVRVVRDKWGYTEFLEKLGKDQQMTFKEGPINPAWVISGTPKCSSLIFDHSYDKVSSTSGLWECTGPAKFDYHYGQDESIYILAGSAEIEYLGKKFTLTPGETTYFAQGTKATWTVTEHVRKTFRFQDPGRPVLYMRRLLK